MKLIEEKFETSRGDQRLYTVRSYGPSEGFGVIDTYKNVFLPIRFWTRDAAWQYLRDTDCGREERVGYGRVLGGDGQNYFICKRFILEGLPIVGAPVTFEIEPPKPGTLFSQATNVAINNKKIVRSMVVPVIATPVPANDSV